MLPYYSDESFHFSRSCSFCDGRPRSKCPRHWKQWAESTYKKHVNDLFGDYPTYQFRYSCDRGQLSKIQRLWVKHFYGLGRYIIVHHTHDCRSWHFHGVFQSWLSRSDISKLLRSISYKVLLNGSRHYTEYIGRDWTGQLRYFLGLKDSKKRTWKSSPWFGTDLRSPVISYRTADALPDIYYMTN